MANLVTIKSLTEGGADYAVPTPSTYTGNTATIVDSARNVEGRMIGTVVRNDVAKITMTWNYLPSQAWAELLSQFSPAAGGSFTRRVTFFNQATNSLITRTMYVSDRNANSFLLGENGLPRGYQNCTFSLIEV